MGWKIKIREVLEQHGPLRSADLIAALGFDLQATGFDVGTRFIDGLRSIRGSFCDSQAQRVLGNMVRRGDVVWQRAANMDNWYRLPDQEFPPEAKSRDRTLRQLMEEVMFLMSEEDYYGKEYLEAKSDCCMEDEWAHNLAAIKTEDVWVEFCPFVLTIHEDGWELADGDPICNWCGNTFTKVYPMDVKATAIVKRMKKERVKHGKGGDKYEWHRD